MFLSDSIFKFLTRKGRNSKINNQLPEIAQVRLSLLAVYDKINFQLFNFFCLYIRQLMIVTNQTTISSSYTRLFESMAQIQLRRQERSSERKNWREEKEQKVVEVNSNAGTFAIDYQRNFRYFKGWKLKKETYIKSSKGWLLSNLIASKKQFGKKIRNIDYFGTCIFKNFAKFLHCPIPPCSLRITFDLIDPDKILIIANRWLDGYSFSFPLHLIPFTLTRSCACADPRVNEIAKPSFSCA